MGGTKGVTDAVQAFLAACKARRTCFQLSRSPTYPDQKILDIVNEAMLHTPSPFNRQTTRVLVLLGKEHDNLWREITKPILKPLAPKDVWPMTEKKIDSFANAHGSILLYESLSTVANMQQEFPHYANYCAQWSEHTSGMHTYVLWTALVQAGFGATLQHYNPLIDLNVASRYNVPSDWQLKGQLIFGIQSGPLKEKTFTSLEGRVMVRGVTEETKE